MRTLIRARILESVELQCSNPNSPVSQLNHLGKRLNTSEPQIPASKIQLRTGFASQGDQEDPMTAHKSGQCLVLIQCPDPFLKQS